MGARIRAVEHATIALSVWLAANTYGDCKREDKASPVIEEVSKAELARAIREAVDVAAIVYGVPPRERPKPARGNVDEASRVVGESFERTRYLGPGGDPLGLCVCAAGDPDASRSDPRAMRVCVCEGASFGGAK
jgi:hypothetical protein